MTFKIGDTEYFLSAAKRGLSWFRADSLATHLAKELNVSENYEDWRLAEISSSEQVNGLKDLLKDNRCEYSKSCKVNI